eukprot:9503888-Pyramimonas_sp.AAC.2
MYKNLRAFENNIIHASITYLRGSGLDEDFQTVPPARMQGHASVGLGANAGMAPAWAGPQLHPNKRSYGTPDTSALRKMKVGLVGGERGVQRLRRGLLGPQSLESALTLPRMQCPSPDTFSKTQPIRPAQWIKHSTHWSIRVNTRLLESRNEVFLSLDAHGGQGGPATRKSTGRSKSMFATLRRLPAYGG